MGVIGGGLAGGDAFGGHPQEEVGFGGGLASGAPDGGVPDVGTIWLVIVVLDPGPRVSPGSCDGGGDEGTSEPGGWGAPAGGG